MKVFTAQEIYCEFTRENAPSNLEDLIAMQSPAGFYTVGNKFHHPDGGDRHFVSLRAALRHARAASNRHAGLKTVFGNTHIPRGGLYCGCGGMSVVSAADYALLPSPDRACSAYSMVAR